MSEPRLTITPRRARIVHKTAEHTVTVTVHGKAIGVALDAEHRRGPQTRHRRARHGGRPQ